MVLTALTQATAFLRAPTTVVSTRGAHTAASLSYSGQGRQEARSMVLRDLRLELPHEGSNSQQLARNNLFNGYRFHEVSC